jgi:tetratricopeptide (TPR) repeat protein
MIIPVPSASGCHLSHPDRSPTKWEEERRNFALIERLMSQSEAEMAHQYLDRAAARIDRRHDNVAGGQKTESGSSAASLDNIDRFMAEPRNAGFYYFSLAQYNHAISCYDRTTNCHAADFARYARCYFELGAPETGLEVLKHSLRRWPHSGELLMEAVWLHARLGDLRSARRLLYDGRLQKAQDATHSYLVRYSAGEHADRGSRYLMQGLPALAWRDFTAALLLDPSDTKALRGWQRSVSLQS